MIRSILLGSLTLIAFVAASAALAIAQKAIGAPAAWLGVALLTVPACALCARLMHSHLGRSNQ